MIDGRNFSDQPVENDLRTYENIRKIATSQGDDYTTGSLLDYPYFREHYNMIAIDLNKNQALDAHPRAIQSINFTGNADRNRTTTMLFIIEEEKKLFWTFRKEL